MVIRQETNTNFVAGAVAVDNIIVYFISDDRNQIIHLTFARERHDKAMEDIGSFCIGAVFSEDKGISNQVQQAIGSYMEGKSHHLHLQTGFLFSGRATVFQQRVWQQISKIGYGSTRSYGDIARSLGNIKLARAVGQACHANPLAMFVPCHRVVGAAGTLGGFAGGAAIKSRLLALERRLSGAER
jgi:methylated-DNA-[protein]-cysteine S-methyltransferase